MFMCILYPLLFTFVQCSEMSTFRFEPSFSDHLLFNDFTLGPSSEKVLSDCARECHRNDVCRRFSMSNDSNICQLYRTWNLPDLQTAENLPGQRYYTKTTDRCPSREGYVALPVVNLCIKVFPTYTVYTDVVYQCNQLGGRPIVLEDVDKATAVIDYLQSGPSSPMYFLGAVIPADQPNNTFVWVDGQPLVRDWWRDNEPSNPNSEKCLFLQEHGLGDVKCDVGKPFICEIVQ